MKKQRVVRGVAVEEGSGNVYAALDYADSESMLARPNWPPRLPRSSNGGR